MDFVHLHCHSDYSTFDGFQSVEKITDCVSSHGMSAVAITDHGKVGGLIKFYKACKKKNLNPILGCEFYLSHNLKKKKIKRYHITILAKNNVGYKNIMKMCSIAHTHMAYNKPRIDFNILKEHSEGLIVLSGCMGGEIPQSILGGDLSEAYKLAKEYKSVWGEDYYLELQYLVTNTPGIEDDEFKHNQILLAKEICEMGRCLDIKVVATNDAHFPDKGTYKYQQVRKSISMGQPLSSPDTDQLYLKTPEEMYNLFTCEGMQKITKSSGEEFLKHTVEISNKCNVEIKFGVAKLPEFEIPTDDEEYNAFNKKTHRLSREQSYLRYLSFKGLEKRGLSGKKYEDRLNEELETIIFTGFDRYFLIVWEYCAWAHSQSIRIGCGRGSGVGSLVLYCLEVIGVNPMSYDITMDRFLYSEAEYHLPLFEIDSESNEKEKAIVGKGKRERSLTKEEHDLSSQLVDICKERIKSSANKFSKEEMGRIKEELLFIRSKPTLCEDIMLAISAVSSPKDKNAPNSIVLHLLGLTSMASDISKSFAFKFFIDKKQSRISPPDIDIDFEHRETILTHLCELYGSDKVALIGVNNKYKPKAAVQFAAKAMDVTDTNDPSDRRFSSDNDKEGKRLSKLMTNLPLSLNQWLGQDPDYKAPNRIVEGCIENMVEELNKNNGQYQEMFDVALHLEGVIRAYGTHAAGVVISADSITDDVPLHVAKMQRDFSDGFSIGDEETSTGLMTTQYDMEEVEELGLLKFDFLQLNNLRQISLALKLIEENTGSLDFDIDELEPDDAEVFKLIHSMKLQGLFQISGAAFSGGDFPRYDKKTGEVMLDENNKVVTYHREGVMKTIGCKDFNDIVAPNALGRPGPLSCGMPKAYAQGKAYPDSIEYSHPDLRPILESTYGQLIYQEQLIKMAQALAGFSFSEADGLRKACAKKKKELLDVIEPKFREGCKKNNVSDSVINEMWGIATEFGQYAFNKSLYFSQGVITEDGEYTIEEMFFMKKSGRPLPRVYSPEGGKINVVDVYDHGDLPVYSVHFEDKTVVKCSMNHKFKTENGVLPLHEIISSGVGVLKNREMGNGNKMGMRGAQGSVGNKSGVIFTQKGMSSLGRIKTKQKIKNRGIKDMPRMRENIRKKRHSGEKGKIFKKMERREPRGFFEEVHGSFNGASQGMVFKSREGSEECFAVDGIRVFSNSEKQGFQNSIQKKESGFFKQRQKNNSRVRRASSFSSTIKKNDKPRCNTGEEQGGQQSHGRSGMFDYKNVLRHLALWGKEIQNTPFGKIDGNNKGRDKKGSSFEHWENVQIEKVCFDSFAKCYDLEVDSEDHLYLLSNGIVSQNSHSVAYGYLCYQTAYLKTYYPAEFISAILTSAANSSDDKLEEVTGLLMKEYEDLEILSPDINKVQKTHYPMGGMKIMAPLFSIKGVGKKISDTVVERRDQSGLFDSMRQFLKSVNSEGSVPISNAVGDILIDKGVFDFFGDRKTSKEELKRYRQNKRMVGAPKKDPVRSKMGDLF